jgi:YD repeat-containing protein
MSHASTCPFSVAWLTLGAAIVLAPACEQRIPDPEEALSGSVCVEVQTRPEYPDVSYYSRKTWDAASRILTQQTSTSATFSEQVGTLKWRYADEGRIIAYVGVEQPFQHDYRYDDHGNVSELRLSYPAVPDLMTPSAAGTWIGLRYDSQYSAAGRLLASTVTTFGDGASSPPEQRTYTEDAEGRCTVVETISSAGQSTVERRGYDDAGRLAFIDVSGGSHTEFRYDDQGRVSSESIVWGSRGQITTNYEYAADGSQTVTRFDTFTDILNDQHVVTTRSPACRTIDDAPGKPADLRCRVR